MTIAIAAPSFQVPSETFIRAHVRTILPGATVLLCDDGGGVEAFGCPTLAGLEPQSTPGSVVARLADGLQGLRRRFDPALGGAAERRVRAFLATHGVRVLLAEYGTMGCRLRLVCRRAGVRLFVHFHGFDATILLREPRWRWYYRRLFADAAGIVAPSRFLANRLEALGCPPAKLHVSPCGIDPGRFPPTRREPGRVIAVGRMVEKKAPQLTIRAFAKVHAALPEARLNVVGDGPLRAACERAVAEHGLGEAVVFHGFQPPAAVAELMARAAVFAQHSVTAANGDMESLGVSLLEAQAAALPVLATDHNGFVDTVAHGETGLLVAEHDVDGMADAMLALLRDPSRGARMGAAGRARVSAHFTHEQVAARLRTILGVEADPTAGERIAS